MAASALGAVAMPLSMLFGPEALQYRLDDSEAKVAIVDESAIDALLAASSHCPALAHVVAVGGAAGRGSVRISLARSAAARFITGSVPGRARSTAQAWVLGVAAKAVDAPEKILLSVDS